MRVILVLIICIVLGVIGLNYMKSHNHTDSPTVESTREKVSSDAASFGDKARDAAVSAKDAIAEKLREWHLSGDDIKSDLQKGGEVIRTKARSAGSSIASSAANAKLVTVIKTKYALDKDLSARAIEVKADQGKVVLAGTVGSEELIGRAVALALDTDGVVEVKSQLKVQ